jgi:hypothetical protein
MPAQVTRTVAPLAKRVKAAAGNDHAPRAVA